MPILGIVSSSQQSAVIVPNSYESISTVTVTSNVGNIEFSSIPATYKHLQIRSIQRATAGAGNNEDQNALIFNGDTGSNYSHTVLYGDGSSGSSARATGQTSAVTGNISGTNPTYFGVNINNYKNTTTYKTIISRNGPSFAVTSYVSLWRASPQAISSMVILLSAGNFNSGSTFTLYGIAAA